MRRGPRSADVTSVCSVHLYMRRRQSCGRQTEVGERSRAYGRRVGRGILTHCLVVDLSSGRGWLAALDLLLVLHTCSSVQRCIFAPAAHTQLVCKRALAERRKKSRPVGRLAVACAPVVRCLAAWRERGAIRRIELEMHTRCTTHPPSPPPIPASAIIRGPTQSLHSLSVDD